MTQSQSNSTPLPEFRLAESLQAACRALQDIEGHGRLVKWQSELWTTLEDSVSKTTGRIHCLQTKFCHFCGNGKPCDCGIENA
jgi:hypothetical protein